MKPAARSKDYAAREYIIVHNPTAEPDSSGGPMYEVLYCRHPDVVGSEVEALGKYDEVGERLSCLDFNHRWKFR
jgi:hypothetical protein